MKKKFKTPPGYRAPLRSRAAILAWLEDRAKSDRSRYGLFTFNVKLHNLKTDFAHLCELARKNGDLAADASPRYLAAVEQVYRAKYDGIWEAAQDNARRSVTDDDTNRMLWDGDRAIAEWTFDGRSGGWLVLKEFDGTNLENLSADWLQECSYTYLRQLYRFLIQSAHDFRRPESEVEHQAAFELFNNYASEVETDAQEAARLAAEARESAERSHWEARDTVTAN